MNDNIKALDELLDVQLNSVEAFTMGDDLMKNAVNDIETLAKVKKTMTEIEMLEKKDEREERESKHRIRQEWVKAGGTIASALLAFGMWTVMNINRAIDEGNGDLMSRTASDSFKVVQDALIRMFRGRRG